MASEDDFNRLMERRTVWTECIGSKDTHGLQRQIFEGVMDLAVFRMTIKMRNLAPRAADDTGTELNGLLFEMIDRSFLKAQTAAIRRLTDDSYPLTHTGPSKDKSVYSLAALLKDMKKHSHLMTRSALIRAGADQDRPFPWREAERHKQIDLLAAVPADKRSDRDVVKPSFFDYLKKRLSRDCRGIQSWATAYVAHAASPSSSIRAEAGNLLLSWQRLWSAYEAIAWVTHSVRIWILEGPHVQIMPLMTDDVAAYLDRPLVEGEHNLDLVRETWRQCEEESKAWLRFDDTFNREYHEYLVAHGVDGQADREAGPA